MIVGGQNGVEQSAHHLCGFAVVADQSKSCDVGYEKENRHGTIR